MTVEILPVSGMNKFLAFCRLPRQIYKGMDGFAPPLDAERWTNFAPKLNPHYKLVDSQAFLAKKDGRYVGRIAASIYKDMKPVDASPAQFGAFDAVDDPEVVKALTDVAEGWLRERSATEICGPFSPSINAETGMLVEGFTTTPMIFMPWHPAYLGKRLEERGYAKARDVITYSYNVRPSDLETRTSIMSRPEWKDRLKIRQLDLKNMKGEAPIIVDIFNDGWSGNWGFVPFTLEQFISIADGLKYVMPADGGFMFELDGEPQAFGVILPNLHEILSDMDGRLFPFGIPKVISRVRSHHFKSGILILFGIRKALQKKAVGGVVMLALIEEMRRRGRKYNVEHIEFGWVLEDNMGMRRPIEMSGATPDKVHRLYAKPLAG